MADITQEGTQTGCIRVLHFVSTLSRGSGVMSVIMNYYRHIDRDKVQFDFLHFIACEDSEFIFSVTCRRIYLAA